MADSSTSSDSSRDQNISRDDIASKFTELKDGVDTAAGSAQGAVTKGAIAGGILLLILVFILGRRRGKAGKTVVEVRRL